MGAVPKLKSKPAPTPPPATDTGVATSNVRLIPIGQLVSNPEQPRQQWSDERDDEGQTALERLAESIKTEGVLQPIVVTNWDDKYLIVCGERRYRAARMAGVKEVPCVLRPGLTPAQVIAVGLVENLQREDLTPVDQAHAIDTLMKRCGWSQRQVGKKLGISMAAVNYKLSLLKLSPELKKDVKKGDLSETQGRVIAQAVAKAPEDKRPEVMKEVHDKVAKAKEAGEKVDVKAVATIAKTVVDKHAAPVPPPAPTAKGKGGKGQPAKEARPASVKPPTPKERSQVAAFAKAVAGAMRAFGPFGAALSDKDARARFAFVLHATQAEAADKAKGLYEFLGKILEEVAEVKRQRMAAKL